MGKVFISIWKIDIDQDYFDIRLILMPEKATASAVYELKGICENLDGKNFSVKAFVTHRGESLVVTVQYILQQINNEFAFNSDIDEDGDGMREWISRMDSGDKRLFLRSLFDSEVKKVYHT